MKAKKLKVTKSKIMSHGSDYPMEGKADGYGYGVRQHQDVVPSMGQGPQGTCGVAIPAGDAPPVAPPAVGHGKGFKGW